MSPKRTYLDLLKYKKKEMDSVSSSFCAAKWLYSTLWLYEGTTSSCHHPQPHRIPLLDALKDPNHLYNTSIKKKCREQMLAGERPSECYYCWEVEDAKEGAISDRVLKSGSFNLDSVRKLKDLDPNKNITPDILEIAFSRNCNLACSYCSPQFSTSWDKFDPSYRTPYLADTYVSLFWKLLPTIIDELKLIRMTGGEPLLSKDFWKIFDWLRENKPDLAFSVNSNLCVSDELIDKLIDKSKTLREFEVFTSCEAIGEQAEYLRDGMVFDKFWNNSKKVIDNANITHFCYMVTVNILSIFSLIDFMNEVEKIKTERGESHPHFFVNILQRPSFMAVDTLPREVRLQQRDLLLDWYKQRVHSSLFKVYELESLKGLIDYLEKDYEPDLTRQLKFKKFFKKYDESRNKDLLKTFPLGDWYTRIKL